MRGSGRNPLVQIILIALVCLLGIGSRRYAHVLPVFVAAYAGDTLWALAAFLGIGLVLPIHAGSSRHRDSRLPMSRFLILLPITECLM
jgi:hypothetical protein